MGYSRRTFLKNSALVMAAANFLPGQSFASFKKETTGLQLYSVREEMGKDAPGTLRQLADIGYKYVEHANYIEHKFYGHPAKEFKKILDDLGLKMISGHVRLEPKDWDESKKDFTDSWKLTVADAAEAGQKYIISPWLDEASRKTYDDILHFMDVFNKCGELCKKNGVRFGYHNHDFEFSTVLNNKKVYDIILQNTDPAVVAHQLDMGNLYNGGAIAIAIVMQYPGRFELMHVKDEIKSSAGTDKYESTVLGEGIVDTRQVCDLGKKSGGTHYFIIEQESYQSRNPLDCAKADLAIMKKWGY